MHSATVWGMARGSWSRSKVITKQAWGVIKSNPYMLAFPVVGAALSMLAVVLVGGAGLGIVGIGEVEQSVQDGETSTFTTVVGIATLAIGIYLATLITQIFMGGLVKCADEELQGRDSSFGAGLSASFSRLRPLMGWAAIETAVGWLIQMVQGNGGNDNALVAILRAVLASLMAVAWSVITFFVLPMIILRGKGPLQAIKESVVLIRRTWGMSIAGGVRIGGLIFLIAVLPSLLLTVLGVVLAIAGSAPLGIPLATIGVLVFIAAQVLVSAMRAIFSVAMLHYVEDGSVVGPFGADELQQAVRVK